MARIRILPEGVTNRIAAGEVVERPVSVVKELMENALDAGARRITVTVERGGRDLIQVADDGEGMARDDLLLAIERYATSKITCSDDLFSIATLGFRGEALPSIASISKMEITTRRPQDDFGTCLTINGGRLISVSETGAPPGTQVSVRRLFFNTPVRRKFLKTVPTEMGHITDAFVAMAMASPGIAFSLTHNGRTVKEMEPEQAPESRARMVLGGDSGMPLIPVALNQTPVTLTGFLAPPEHSRSASSRIFIFVNHRMISDRGILSALVQGFRGRLMKGRFPMAVLFMTLPFDQVDVNVHPSKREVRFVHEKQVLDGVREAVSRALIRNEKGQMALRSGKTAEAKSQSSIQNEAGVRDRPLQRNEQDTRPWGNHIFHRDTAGSIRERGPRSDGRKEEGGGQKKENSASVSSTQSSEDFQDHPVVTGNDQQAHDRIQGLFQWGPAQKKIKSRFSSEDPSDEREGDSISLSSPKVVPSGKHAADHETADGRDSPDGPVGPGVQSGLDETGADESPEDHKVRDAIEPESASVSDTGRANDKEAVNTADEDFRVVGQVLSTYIVTELVTGEVEIIDQHAAHERIVYEGLKQRTHKLHSPSQQLALPQVLDLGHLQAAVLERMMPELMALGFEIEPFGDGSFALKALPAIMDHIDGALLIQDMVDHLTASGMVDGDSGTITGAWLDELLITMACHRSVRARQQLNEIEMQDLIRRLNRCDNALHCPHGRPIRLRWSARFFEKQFKRVL